MKYQNFFCLENMISLPRALNVPISSCLKVYRHLAKGFFSFYLYVWGWSLSATSNKTRVNSAFVFVYVISDLKDKPEENKKLNIKCLFYGYKSLFFQRVEILSSRFWMANRVLVTGQPLQYGPRSRKCVTKEEKAKPQTWLIKLLV